MPSPVTLLWHAICNEIESSPIPSIDILWFVRR
jgi:hypothetical protein